MAYTAWTIPFFVAALAHAQALPPPPPAAPAQPKVEKADEDSVFRSGVEVVNLLATVRGGRDKIVGDLQQSDFKIFEDGKEQQIRNFAKDLNVPLNLSLMIDVSESMDVYFEKERDAGGVFFKQLLRPKDRAMIGAFRAETEVFQDWTDNLDFLQKGLGKLDPKMKFAVGTVLYDAIKLVSEKKMTQREGRRVMVVLTDGQDYGSRNSALAALNAAQASETMIYIIQFPLDPKAGNPTEQMQRDMHSLTEQTGGHLFEISGANDIPRIFEVIQNEVRAQYSLSYISTNTKHDGKYRKIKIEMTKREYRVQTRQGYYAPKE